MYSLRFEFVGLRVCRLRRCGAYRARTAQPSTAPDAGHACGRAPCVAAPAVDLPAADWQQPKCSDMVPTLSNKPFCAWPTSLSSSHAPADQSAEEHHRCACTGSRCVHGSPRGSAAVCAPSCVQRGLQWWEKAAGVSRRELACMMSRCRCSVGTVTRSADHSGTVGKPRIRPSDTRWKGLCFCRSVHDLVCWY